MTPVGRNGKNESRKEIENLAERVEEWRRFEEVSAVRGRCGNIQRLKMMTPSRGKDTIGGRLRLRFQEISWGKLERSSFSGAEV